MPGHELPSSSDRVEIPEGLEPDIQWMLQKFMLIRESNRAAFTATSEEEFESAVSDELASQRVYLEHLIDSSQTVVKAFMGEAALSLPEFAGSPRDSLIQLLDRTSTNLAMVFLDKHNWGRRVVLPYKPFPLAGLTVLSELKTHEAEHEGRNRDALGHFGIPLPEAVIRPFGK